MPQPNLVMILSLVFGSLTSLFTFIAISTEGWENIIYDVPKLKKISGFVSNESVIEEAQGFFKIVIADKAAGNKSTFLLRNKFGGIWRICDHISDTYRQGSSFQDAVKTQAQKDSYFLSVFFEEQCFNYITGYQNIKDRLDDNDRVKSLSIFRMHNIAASCIIVEVLCLITAIITGIFGLWQRQVSACMVTGVMYIVAGVFCCFGLLIMLTKIGYQEENSKCYSLNPANDAICSCTIAEQGWSEAVGWLSFSFSIVTLGAWLFLARCFRLETAKSII